MRWRLATPATRCRRWTDGTVDGNQVRFRAACGIIVASCSAGRWRCAYRSAYSNGGKFSPLFAPFSPTVLEPHLKYLNSTGHN